MSARSTLRWLGRSILSLLTALLLVGAVLYLHYLWAGPELQSWHRARLDAEFTAADYTSGRVSTLAQYRERERRLMIQVKDEVSLRTVGDGRSGFFNRYVPGSRSDPRVWETNWNMTFVLEPAGKPRGGVLLLHGLTDSPYSLRSLGLSLAADGYRVVGLRLPGHGTAPAGLLRFEIEDLEAATRLAVRDLRGSLGRAPPIELVGYSNGAALAVSYALDALEDDSLPRPAHLVLISPAIGITPLAALGRIRTRISEIPGLGRAAWQLIEPEIDPYKYQSFPWHAAGVTQRLTSTLGRRIARLAEDGPVRGLPSILAFVSTVDSTVHAAKVVDALLGKLAPEGHELVLFDVNRLSVVQPLLVDDPAPLTRRLVEQPHRPYALSVVTNVTEQSARVMERRVPAQATAAEERILEAEWPRNVFSLSHVALPFPPDDPLYGYDAPRTEHHVQLGRLEARGENGVLNLPGWLLTRQRSNPFHGYLVARIERWLGAPVAADLVPEAVTAP
ncbi:MAG TPA: alpha/beta fold hydrolase [Steroidobacteraceae bacterium]|nr:alpha/beta fold hydrolase [Steroidobacteraceae bacterium]